MCARFCETAKLFVPPVVVIATQRLRGIIRRTPSGRIRIGLQRQWEHVPEGWRPRGAAITGWRDPSIVATQRRQFATYAALIRGTAPLGFHFFATGPIGTVDEGAHNAHMAFSYVLARTALGKARISVLDWGGGIGYARLLAEALLPEIETEYVVKELPEIAALGREVMPSVRFETDDATCFSRRYDLVVASSALQYEEDWRGLMTRLARAAKKFLFLARMPIAPRAHSFVVVQRPQRFGYDTEYLSWVINREELLAHASRLNLVLEREFLAGGAARIHNAPDEMLTRGFLFRTAPQRT